MDHTASFTHSLPHTAAPPHRDHQPVDRVDDLAGDIPGMMLATYNFAYGATGRMAQAIEEEYVADVLGKTT